MSDIEGYEADMELQLYREYRDVAATYTYRVETERRMYLANQVDLKIQQAGADVFYELTLGDAWVWDPYRTSRFVRSVRVLTFKDVNVEELEKPEFEM